MADDIEPRQLGVGKLTVQTSLFMDPATVDGSNVQVVCAAAGTYAGSITATLDAADLVAVTFDPALPDEDCCEVTFDGMGSIDGGAPIVGPVVVRTLRGDVNRDGVVSTADASIIKPKFGGDPAIEGPEFDFNTDGIISTADFSQVKPLFGNSAAPCP